MNNNFNVYIGIDVSKHCLDIVIHPNNKYMQFKNSLQDIKKIISKASKFNNPLVVMEATGGYEKTLVTELQKANINVCVVNPRQIRDFAKAFGILAKTDKIDAKVIALFASKKELKPNLVLSEEQHKISENNARRQQLINMIVQEKNRLDKASPEQRKSINRILKALEKELKVINSTQEKIIEESKEFTEKKEILESVKGIGGITANAIIAELPEIGTLGKKQISSLAGLAPHCRDSGTLKGKRTIWGGRASVRKALYMATLTAIKYNPIIKAFFSKLCLAGKAKMTAIIACMRKLLVIINAMVHKKEKWKEPSPLTFFKDEIAMS